MPAGNTEIVARQLLVRRDQATGGCHVHEVVSQQESSPTPVALRKPDRLHEATVERTTSRSEVETLSSQTSRDGGAIRRSHLASQTAPCLQSAPPSRQGNAHSVETGAAFRNPELIPPCRESSCSKKTDFSATSAALGSDSSQQNQSIANRSENGA